MHLNEKNRTPKLTEADEGPSKSELKRQMTERQKLAEVLAALSSDALKTIPLDETIKNAVAETNRIKSFEAIRRHKQYLGKLMRALDDEELEVYLKECFHDDIVEAVKMNDLWELIDVEIFDDARLS